MIEQEFSAMIKRIKEYFDRPKYATWDRHAMWFKRIKHIPAEAIPFIERCIYDQWNIPPANLPRYMIIYFDAWKSANASKFISYPRTVCEECGGKGLLWVKRPITVKGQPVQFLQIPGEDGFLMETVSYRCGSCENWQRHCHAEAKPAATIAELIERGFTLI